MCNTKRTALFKSIEVPVYLLALLFCLSIFLAWYSVDAGVHVKRRGSFPDVTIAVDNRLLETDIQGLFKKFSGIPSASTSSWTGFRGSLKDNVSREEVPLINTLESRGIEVLWSVGLGEGYAGPSIANGRVYVLDHDEKEHRDVLRCFSMEDGHEIWARSYQVKIKRNHGFSRTVPEVNDKYCLTMGPKCHVSCVDAINGDFKWGRDLVREYGTEVPLWYTGQCPLMDRGIAVIAPAGKDKLVVGFDCETGAELFYSPNPGGLGMSHSSVIPMNFFGKKFYVYCAVGGIAGVSAEDTDRGKLEFLSREWKHSVVSPSPVQVGSDRILVTAGYGGGGMMFKVMKEDGSFRLEKLLVLDKKVFACEQHSPVYYKEHLYTVMPPDAGELNRQLVCMDPEGGIVWSSGPAHRFGLGPFMIADDKIFILDDEGTLTAAEASIASFRMLWECSIMKGREAWAPLALADGRMLLRDLNKMYCLNLRKN